MELINELLKGGFIYDNWAEAYIPAVQALLAEAVPCDVTNVAEWLHANPPGTKSYARLSPMFLMPHNVMWFEYPVLEFTDHVHGWERFAVLMLHHSLGTKDPIDPDSYAFAYVFVGRRERKRPKLLCCTLKFRHGENGQELSGVKANLQEKGRIKLAETEDLNKQIEDDEVVEKIIASLALPAMTAMTFFHCPNVRVVNRWPSKAHAAAFKQKHGVALRVMKEIEIHLPRDINKGGGAGVPRGLTAAHFVRGHFKRYNNLFGSISGVFFWRPHVRGDGDPLPRSYNVHEPTKKHHGHCIVELK